MLCQKEYLFWLNIELAADFISTRTRVFQENFRTHWKALLCLLLHITVFCDFYLELGYTSGRLSWTKSSRCSCTLQYQGYIVIWTFIWFLWRFQFRFSALRWLKLVHSARVWGNTAVNFVSSFWSENPSRSDRCQLQISENCRTCKQSNTQGN